MKWSIDNCVETMPATAMLSFVLTARPLLTFCTSSSTAFGWKIPSSRRRSGRPPHR